MEASNSHSGCVVGRKKSKLVIFRKRKGILTSSSLMIIWAMLMISCKFIKDAGGLSKCTGVLEGNLILSLLSEVIVEHLKYSLSCDRL